MAAWALLPEHCRAARYLLGWSAQELAERSGVAVGTVTRFELEQVQCRERTLRELIRAFEHAGVRLVPGDGSPVHVQCSDGQRVVIQTR